MTNAVNPVPEGFHTVTPYMTIKDAARAIEFYEEAFGAREIFRWDDSDGKVRHAEVVIGDSPIMLHDESPDWNMHGPQAMGGSPVQIFLYVQDADATIERAVAAGATELMPAEDHALEGDRRGGVRDPFGHVWWIATHIENVSREEIQKRHDDLPEQ